MCNTWGKFKSPIPCVTHTTKDWLKTDHRFFFSCCMSMSNSTVVLALPDQVMPCHVITVSAFLSKMVSRWPTFLCCILEQKIYPSKQEAKWIRVGPVANWPHESWPWDRIAYDDGWSSCPHRQHHYDTSWLWVTPIAFSPMLPAMTLFVIPTTLGWYAPNYYSNVQVQWVYDAHHIHQRRLEAS